MQALGFKTEKELDFWQGKFRRTCEPKRASGTLEVPEDIFQQYQSKGATKDKLFELFVKAGGHTVPFLVSHRLLVATQAFWVCHQVGTCVLDGWASVPPALLG